MEEQTFWGLDSIPDLLKMGKEGEKDVKKIFRKKLEQQLPQMIERYKLLPAIIVEMGKYWELLSEARALFVEGYFYSCVAMCGATAERIAKELLRNTILLRSRDEWTSPSDEQAFVLDRIEMNDVRELLVKSGVIDQKLRMPFQKLAELRNRYTHALGESAHDDAQKAIEYLHTIVEGTISAVRHYET
ncbi:hypothetical protein HKBW3S03_00920 [Candidatus Hakubella thermalkaliphila]|uniref:DUF4145 domain-containing protein n=1 Tax=Candidatus Hakubella thermalkaliphila TaxID=2754717 RepID=A0A6V8NGP2_9ACTN|nr:hypothetical protein [Candidatus Hakubella thermalkaliphila]GFP19415.1 hypothetical protein HKBW3S03_00920 [Candidatus Hakubella thermalkaliphila]GFP21749.1 hypothetical protein HKBW3S06_00976 [Candidatus Hakubella thermalkaliphila]GFP30714.1 hypothetical protein HKBW3S34_01634 [Candidatus Hakubella thermalkaliphila]GFP36547.1 hypothetical protein HKBW3S44_00230 [Candidatus Hakubella thermalkaliphila]GFP40032.1 hypothetical protein HKBW3S47_01729 [Candidatus Hakubella thermalkaliphila]